MEKMIEEEEIKGLEEEIDTAVDRLFVEKKGSAKESLLVGSPTPAESPTPIESLPPEPSYEKAKAPDRRTSVHSPSEPPPLVKPLEKMETQLLSLEWEITKENLEKTEEEILALKGIMKHRPDIASVLNLMEKVLIHMNKNRENIKPPHVKFLLDSKETIKLLMRRETEGEINIYKKLSLGGIEARFLGLEGMEAAGAKKPSFNASEERDETAIPKMWKEQIEGILSKMDLFSKKLDENLKKIDQQVYRIGQMSRVPPEELFEKRPLPVDLDITILKIDGKLIGIESHKVFKLYRIPNVSRDKLLSQQKIRLKDYEVKVIDLKKIFPIEERNRKNFSAPPSVGTGAGRQEEMQILTLKEDEAYKGFIVDQVLKKISVQLERSEKYGEYFLGIVHWSYQEQPIEIPILDSRRI
jgi:chemotaxis protein histidine kinase CheA